MGRGGTQKGSPRLSHLPVIYSGCNLLVPHTKHHFCLATDMNVVLKMIISLVFSYYLGFMVIK